MVYLGVEYDVHVKVKEGLDIFFEMDNINRLVIYKGDWHQFKTGSIWVDGVFNGDYNNRGTNIYSIIELTAQGELYVRCNFNGTVSSDIYDVSYWFKYHTLVGIDYGPIDFFKRRLNYFKF